MGVSLLSSRPVMTEVTAPGAAVLLARRHTSTVGRQYEHVGAVHLQHGLRPFVA